jgi:hypothetical protein
MKNEELKRFGFFWMLLKLFITEPDYIKLNKSNTIRNPYSKNDFVGNGHGKNNNTKR